MNYLRFIILSITTFFELSVLFLLIGSPILQFIFAVSICIQFAFIYESYLGLMQIKREKLNELKEVGGLKDGRKIKAN